MQSMLSLVSNLQNTFRQFDFRVGDTFYWSPTEKTIFYTPKGDPALLLHELGHALLGHQKYSRDIQLIELEREAWEYTRNHLSECFDITLNDSVIEDALDTYREWLHLRSTCPTCASTGLQIKEKTYSCPACFASWSVNEARICGLKRKLLPTK